MVTALTSGSNQRCSQSPKRPPSLRSDSDNVPRRPKAREVSSRYLSLSTSSSSSNSSSSTNTTSSSSTSGYPISSRRSQCPTVCSRAAISTPKSCVRDRAVSAERRRPAATAVSNAERMLTASIRSSSVSFQGGSFALPLNKVKQPPMSAESPGGLRKGTPERRKAGVTPVRDRTERDRENSKPCDQQHRWPGRSCGANSDFLTRSLDCGAGRGKLKGYGNELKGLRKYRADKSSGNKGVKVDSDNFEVTGNDDLDRQSISNHHLISESVSSLSTAMGKVIPLRGRPHGIVVPARFGQEANNQGHKELDPASPATNNASSRKGPPKLGVAKKFQNDSPMSSPRIVIPSRGLSPLRSGARLASPSKALTTSTGAMFRRMASPTRARYGLGSLMSDNNMCSTPSMLSFAADVRRGKLGENRIVDAHDLRLLHNRQLQWQLANVRVENALVVQEQAAKRSLYNAWLSTSNLRHSVKSKRTELQLLRRNLKIYYILKEHVLHLESWDLIDTYHCNSLSGIIKALEASTIRVPVVGGAKVNVQKVHEAIASAVDVMQGMASSICSMLIKVEQTNLLVSELSSLSLRECDLLGEIKDFLLTTFIPLQVMYCSLRTHVLQLQQP